MGEFKIVRLLGMGGMGRVYLAEQEKLERQVAVKVLPQQLVADRAAIERFEREAKLAAKLAHPNIGQILTIGSQATVHFVAMELIAGGDVSALMREKGRIPLDEATTIIRQALLGVASAHAKDIIHRDLKPQNLMITEDGVVKVMDFGLARAATADSSLTASGAVLGTPLYMSPEQAEGKKVDLRTDIYALGATLYHMICGRPPFQGETPLSTLLKHLTEPLPSPRDLDPDIPEPVCDIIYKMMAKQLEDRYQTCEEVLADLDAYREAHGVSPARPISPIRPIGPISPTPAAQADMDAATSPAQSYGDRTTWRDGVAKAEAERDAATALAAPRPRRRTGLLVAGLAAAAVLCVLSILFVLSGSPAPSPEEPPDAGKAGAPIGTPGPAATEKRPLTTGQPTARQETPPEQRTYENSLGMRFTKISPGGFRMGSEQKVVDDLVKRHKKEDWFIERALMEGPRHAVRITQPFFLGIHEVRQDQFQRLMRTNPSKLKGGNRPVEQVTWYEAATFCQRLNGSDKKRPKGYAYRLPTEAEWEYACRAGANTSFHFGDNASQLRDYGWTGANAGRQTHEVGQKKPSPWGLYDMHGNVWEWCLDGVRTYTNDTVYDPLGPSSDADRLWRGGAWISRPETARSAWREWSAPSDRSEHIGFRVALAREGYTNSLGMKLMKIPAGEFVMGSTDQEIKDALALNNDDLFRENANSAKPRHKVRITRDFYLGASEVTQNQYRAVMGTTPSKFKGGEGLKPVEQVTWHDAKAFWAWLNGNDSTRPVGYEYRLPTEAEWEYACRAGTTTPYSFGDDADALDSHCWHKGNSGAQTREVATRKPNAWGLYDMHGNVWEWCEDCYSSDFYGRTPAADPLNREDSPYRVERGGSWRFSAVWGRSAGRHRARPDDCFDNLGFRVALVPVRRNKVELTRLPQIRKDAKNKRWAVVEAYIHEVRGYPIKVDEPRDHWDDRRAYRFYFSTAWFDDGAAILTGTNPAAICWEVGIDAHWMFNQSFRDTWRYLWSELEAGRPVLAPGILGKAGMQIVVGAEIQNGQPFVTAIDRTGRAARASIPNMSGLKNYWVDGLHETPVGKADAWWIARPVLVGRQSPHGPLTDTKDQLYIYRLIQEAVAHARSIEPVTTASDEPGLFDLFRGQYVPGIAGLKTWRRRFASLSQNQVVALLKHPNFPIKCYNHQAGRTLAEGRKRMAQKLRSPEAKLGPIADYHLAAAARHYDAVAAAAERWLVLFYGLGSNWQEAAKADPKLKGKDPFKILWDNADKSFADAAKRREGVKLIEQMIGAEKNAVADLEKALAAWTKAVQIREGEKTWLQPIPRVPLKVEYVDEKGRVVRTRARDAGGPLGCLYQAFRMAGHSVTEAQVAAASGLPFRFAFDAQWQHDPEYITPVDALASACQNLGFECRMMRNRPLDETLAAIEKAIDNGQAVLAGLEARTWLLIVGYDKKQKKYYHVGGYLGRWERKRLKVGEAPNPFLPLDECAQIAIPQEDWYSCYYGPDQVAKNAIAVIGKKTNITPRGSITKTLQLALEMHRPRRIERANLELRQAALTPRTQGFFVTRPGHFDTGTDALRKWAAAIRGMKSPTHNFGIIHANDTTLGMQIRAIAEAHRYLAWAAEQCDGEMRRRLRSAAKLFREVTQIDMGVLCRYPMADTPEAHQKIIVEHPALVYIVDAARKPRLGPLAAGSRPCHWGLSVLPDQATFEMAKRLAAANLHRIADLRDKAFSEIQKALAPEPADAALMPKADRFRQDTFSLTVQAAARKLGKDVDYETVYVLSTNPFAPDVRPDEPCGDSWRMQGRGRCLDLVCAALGLQVRPVTKAWHAPVPPMPEDKAKRAKWMKQYHLLPWSGSIIGAHNRQEVVVTDHEWDPHHHGAWWCDWGLITEVRPGAIVGATANGRNDNPLTHLTRAWALSLAKPALDPYQADLAVLRRAVARIRGNRAPFQPDGRVVFGLDAMDAWIARMGTKFWSRSTALATREGALVLVAHLRKCATRFPEAARPHLEAAANSYDRIATLLSPALDQGLYRKWHLANDIAKQKEHAQKVLKPVRGEFAKAADAMEKALTGADGLVVWYPFTGDANDQSGNGHHAQVKGARLVVDRFGRTGSANAFDDKGGVFVKDIRRPPREITVSTWARYDGSGIEHDWGDFVFHWGGDDNYLILGLHKPNRGPSAGKTCFTWDHHYTRIKGQDECGGFCLADEAVVPGRWYHLAATFGNGRHILYVDGQVQRDVARGKLPLVGDLVTLGCSKNLADKHYLNGAIDDVRIYSRALSSFEIQELYHEGGYARPVYENRLGMRFVKLPAGELLMGSSDEQIKALLAAHGDDHFVKTLTPAEVPEHKVRITSSFLMGVTEVTQAQLMRATGKSPSQGRKGWNLPVESVTWHEAKAFCQWLNENDAQKPLGFEYRLPTEAEWEYACRAGTTALRYCGDDEAALDAYEWYKHNSGDHTHDVATKRPNPWGLHDMLGNVLEWCEDVHDGSFYQRSPTDDPLNTQGDKARVTRIGGFLNWPWHCRSAFRTGAEADSRGRDRGFRVALVPSRECLVIDLSGGQDAKSHPVTKLEHGPPPDLLTNKQGPGGTNKYKTIHLVLRRIPAGTFTMGSPRDEVGRVPKAPQREPLHKVRITEGFHIGVFEVTQAQYHNVMGANPSKFAGKLENPVEMVSWNDVRRGQWPGSRPAADTFLGRLSAKTGLTFDLPTAAQWEACCRAGTKSALSNGKGLRSATEKAPALDEVAWYRHSAGDETRPVGGKAPNGFGLYDMHGNVWEWCLDWFADPPEAALSVTDPTGPAKGAERVRRGGGWNSHPANCRSASGWKNSPDERTEMFGFRVVLRLAP